MTHTCTLKNDVLLIKLRGDLIEDFHGHSLFQEVAEYVNQAVLLSAIDMSEVRFVNSSGIGLLISLLTKFRNRGGELVLINPSEHTRKMLIATKLYAIFTIAETEEFAASLLKESI